MTVRDVKLQIFKFFRPLIKDPDISKQIGKKGVHPDRILEEEYNYFFDNKDNQSSSFEA